jgi:hypothetical protein
VVHSVNLKRKLFEGVFLLHEGDDLLRREANLLRNEQLLNSQCVRCSRRPDLIVINALVRGMHIDDDEAIVKLTKQIAPKQLSDVPEISVRKVSGTLRIERRDIIHRLRDEKRGLKRRRSHRLRRARYFSRSDIV